MSSVGKRARHETYEQNEPTMNVKCSEDLLRSNGNAIATQWKESKFCDATIVVEDRQFKAHRTILAIASQFFDTLFSNDFKESKNNSVSLKDMKADVFQAALHFCYEGHCTFDAVLIDDMLCAAVRLQMPHLQNAVIVELKRTLSFTNCLSLWNLAEMHSLQTLVDAARRSTAEHFGVVSREMAFHSLPHANLVALLKEDCLDAAEPDVFRAVVSWVHAQNVASTPEVFSLMKKVRFGIMPSEFMRSVMKHGPHDLMCDNLLMHILTTFIYEKAYNEYHDIFGIFDHEDDNFSSLSFVRQPLQRWKTEGCDKSLMCHIDNRLKISCGFRDVGVYGHLIVPFGEPVEKGVRAFTVKLLKDSNDNGDAATGFGFIAQDKLSAARMQRVSPNYSGHEGLWWLRRFETRVYNTDKLDADVDEDVNLLHQEHAYRKHEKMEFPEGAEVRMYLDMDQGNATFFIDGYKVPTKACGIRGPVVPCVVVYSQFYDSDKVFELCNPF